MLIENTSSEPRAAAEADVLPAKKVEKVKAIIRSFEEIMKGLRGNVGKPIQTKIVQNPEVKIIGQIAQPLVTEQKGRPMTFNYITSLYPEQSDYVLTENEISFLELTSHKYGVDFDDLLEIYMDGVEHWENSDDDERTPEQYGYYFVNEEVETLMEKRARDVRQYGGSEEEDAAIFAQRARKLEYQEKEKELKNEYSMSRTVTNYFPELAPAHVDPDSPDWRYDIHIDENPEDPKAYEARFKVRAKTPEHAYATAIAVHSMVLGKAAKNVDMWNIKVAADRTPVGTSTTSIWKRNMKKVRKPKTFLGKISHRLGKASVELAGRPRLSPKRRKYSDSLVNKGGRLAGAAGRGLARAARAAGRGLATAADMAYKEYKNRQGRRGGASDDATWVDDGSVPRQITRRRAPAQLEFDPNNMPDRIDESYRRHLGATFGGVVGAGMGGISGAALGHLSGVPYATAATSGAGALMGLYHGAKIGYEEGLIDDYLDAFNANDEARIKYGKNHPESIKTQKNLDYLHSKIMKTSYKKYMDQGPYYMEDEDGNIKVTHRK